MSKNFKEYKKRNNVLRVMAILINVVGFVAIDAIGLEFGGLYAIIGMPILPIITTIIMKIDSHYFDIYFNKDCEENELKLNAFPEGEES